MQPGEYEKMKRFNAFMNWIGLKKPQLLYEYNNYLEEFGMDPNLKLKERDVIITNEDK